MKRFLVVVSMLTAILMLAPKPAQAIITMYDSRAAWEAAVGGIFSELDIASQVPEWSILSAGTPLTGANPGDTLTFSIDLQGLQVGSSWATWSGGQFPAILYTMGATSLTGTFSGSGPQAFGFEMEPNPTSVYDMTLLLSDGSILTRAIDGYGGAGFFGWAGDVSIQSMTISSAVDFGLGRLVCVAEPFEPVVPEPMTLSLFSMGLLGLLGLKKRRV
jgi:hypothetical protein